MSEATGFTLNGSLVTADADPSIPLIDVLRNRFGLRGVHFGCGEEQCGACMVLVDGVPVYSCRRTLGDVAGRSVETVESLGGSGTEHPLLRAFLDRQAGQCGYCLPGILMSAKALLAEHAHPTRDQIATALDRHLCRCGAHNRILDAVEDAAAITRAGQGA